MHPALFFFHFLFLLVVVGAYWAAGRLERAAYGGLPNHDGWNMRNDPSWRDGR